MSHLLKNLKGTGHTLGVDGPTLGFPLSGSRLAPFFQISMDLAHVIRSVPTPGAQCPNRLAEVVIGQRAINYSIDNGL
jgi:hypothetical protein